MALPLPLFHPLLSSVLSPLLLLCPLSPLQVQVATVLALFSKIVVKKNNYRKNI
jgi:hypothetical protein